jgi:hypothetical protein
MHPPPQLRLIPPLAPLLLAALCLSGCPSLTERAGLPPSIDRAQALESSGEPAEAARVYEDLAAQNSGAERNRMLLRAARDYLAVKRSEDAARVLAKLEAPLTPPDTLERALSNVEVALDRGQTQEAARQLHAIPVPGTPEAATRYHDLQTRLAALPATPPGPVPAPGAQAAAHIALLLPITGRANAAAVSVRDGFMTAYYQAPAKERPRVGIYDTGTQSVAEALTQAARQGADFIVGPLTREEVTAAAEFAGPRAPVLALNFLPPEQPAPPRFYQYALSPEDEARLAARRVLEDHHRRGVALVPSGDWGTRVLAAFKQELQAGGGDLVATGTIESGRTDYAATITEVLRLSDSSARNHRLESILATKLQFEPRRRNDIEFIFAPAPANIERLLRPQLRFHYAGDSPTRTPTRISTGSCSRTCRGCSGATWPMPCGRRPARHGPREAHIAVGCLPSASMPFASRRRCVTRASRAKSASMGSPDTSQSMPSGAYAASSAGHSCTRANCTCCRRLRREASARAVIAACASFSGARAQKEPRRCIHSAGCGVFRARDGLDQHPLM